MPATVRVNNLTLAHKGTGGYARSTLPDVCKTPSVPVPYVNTSFISTLTKGTTTVFADGFMIAVKGSEQATSIGDEPGVGKGVKSGTQLDRATWLSWSPDVFMEYRAANRLTDKMLMNNGNTVCLAGHWDPKVDGPKGKDLCKEACECVEQEKDNDKKAMDKCFADRMKKLGYNATGRPTPQTMQDGLLSNAIYSIQNGVWAMKMSRNEPGMPSGGRSKGSRAPDVTQMQNGQPSDIYEMKFGDDDWGEGQEEAYKKIARANGGKLYKIDVDKNCDCDGYQKDKKEAQESAVRDAAARAAAGAAARYIAKRVLTGPVGEALTLWDIVKYVFRADPAL